jgi:hypothetical protein
MPRENDPIRPGETVTEELPGVLNPIETTTTTTTTTPEPEPAPADAETEDEDA